MTLRCRCLGSLEVHDGDGWRPVTGAKVRALLAVLVVHVGQHLPSHRLVAEMWAGKQPASAPTLVRGYVLTLRRAFGDDGPAIVLGHANGYRLDLPPAAIDVHVFDALCAEGQGALRRGDAATAARVLSEALGLCRGPAMADVPPLGAVTAYAAGIEERRLGAMEARIESGLLTGRHGEVLGELRRLVAEHPTRERLVALWMRALQADGRRAEALDAYRTAHRRLVERFGIGPGPDLRTIHGEILAAEDAGPAPPAAPSVGAPAGRRAEVGDDGWEAPSQTPADIADFTGRAAELAYGLRVLSPADSSTVRVLGISGPPGVGKSTLAVRLAHGARASYPDGQFYVDLSGPDGAADPTEVVGMLLRASGVPGAVLPERADERAALLRSRLADRRVLVVLENATGERQVRTLLPGGAGCAVIVTSRSRLSGLEGCHLVDLDVFSFDEALDLLERVVGATRVRRHRAAAQQLVALCGRLPLAVRIAAARAARAPRTPLTWYATRVADEHHRLDELRLGDLDVRSSIETGYALLDHGERRVLRLLALLDVADFPAWVAGAVADIDERGSDRALHALAEQRLLDEVGVDRCGQSRYRFHDLIRLFARERATVEPPTERAAAVERAMTGWLVLARRAQDRLSADAPAVVAGPAGDGWLPAAVVQRAVDAPFDWFEAERDSIGDLVAQCAALGRPDLAWGLAAASSDFYRLRGRRDDAQVTPPTITGTVEDGYSSRREGS